MNGYALGMSTTLDELRALAVGPVHDGVRAAMLRAVFDAGEGRVTNERAEHVVIDAILALYRFMVTFSPTLPELLSKRDKFCRGLHENDVSAITSFASYSR